jgi:hypothetical protein
MPQRMSDRDRSQRRQRLHLRRQMHRWRLRRTPVTCESDQRNTRACNGTQTCTVTPLSGTPCSDGNACTSNDICNEGVCVSGPQVTCPLPDQCVPSEQCLLPGTCNPSTGLCSTPSKPDGTPCDDGHLCTRHDNWARRACAPAAPRPIVSVRRCGEHERSHDGPVQQRREAEQHAVRRRRALYDGRSLLQRPLRGHSQRL